MTRDGDFWTSESEYEDLVKQYEQNIELMHPPFVTSNGIGHRFVHKDGWCASKVTYYKYRGPNL